MALLCAGWVLASVGCALGSYRNQWTKYAPEMDLFTRERADASLCGMAIYRHSFAFTGGYTYLHRPVQMSYFVDDDVGHPAANLAAASAGFNNVMAWPQNAGELPASYRETACEGSNEYRVCLYQRPGGCVTTPSAFEVNTVLKRIVH